MKKFLFFWVPHALLLWIMVGSAIYYFVKTDEVIAIFAQLGYPAFTVYFNATAKILGGIAIVLPHSPTWLKEWAYAGYLYIILLALQATLMTMPEGWIFMVISLAIWGLAYWQFKKRIR